jgi:hypothetical protein
MYRIRELYGCTGTPNEGVKWEPTKIAAEIKRIENDDPQLKGRKIMGVADPSIWDKSRGESVAQMMERVGIYWSPGDNTRIAGKMQVHYRLSFEDDGQPMLYIFNTCKHFLRTFPDLVYDETDVEDVDTTQEDHIYDELRYMCMERPITPKIPKATIKPYDPLDIDPITKYDKYAFMRM